MITKIVFKESKEFLIKMTSINSFYASFDYLINRYTVKLYLKK